MKIIEKLEIQLTEEEVKKAVKQYAINNKVILIEERNKIINNDCYIEIEADGTAYILVNTNERGIKDE